MERDLKVLILEDNENDAFFAVRQLKKGGFEFESTRVEELGEFEDEILKKPDLILADFWLPKFNALEALAVMKEHELDLPFVLISGKISEETAVRCIKAGASDYVNKDHLDLLPGAVRQALAEYAFRQEKLQMERALAEREAKYRKLFEDSNEGIVVTDLEGVVIDCNRAFVDLLKYEREEIIGQPISIFSQDEKKRGQMIGLLEKDKFIENFELEFTKKNNVKSHGLVTISYLNDDSGKPDALLALVRDVTERVKDQREMEKIVAINTAMRSATDKETLIPIVMDLLIDISSARGAAIELISEVDGEMVLKAACGVWKLLETKDFLVKNKKLAKLIGSSEAISFDTKKAKEFLSAEALEGLETVVCVPLTSGNIEIGMIWLGCADEGFKETLHLVQVIAQITSNTIHRFNLNENNLRALQESQAVARISRTLNEHLDLEKVFSLIVEEAVKIVAGANRAVIHLFDDENQRLHAVAYSSRDADGITLRNLLNIRVSPRNEFDFGFLSEEDVRASSMSSGKGIAGLAIAEHRTINVADTRDDPRYLQTAEQINDLSLVVSPIMSGDQPLGTLSIISTQVGVFDRAVEQLLENLCVQAATAIENARLLEGERQAREVAEAQTKISTLLNQSLELDEVLDTVLTYALGVFNATAAIILLISEEKPLIARHTGYDFLGEAEAEYTTKLEGFIRERIEAKDARFKKSFVVPDTQLEEIWYIDPADDWRRSFALVPLFVGEEIIGVLSVESSKPNVFGEREIQLFEVFSNNAASAINNAQLYEDLEKALLTEQATRARLIRADKLAGMGRMVASVAHELNNPLQTIKNCMFLIEQNNMDPEGAEILDLGMSEVERLTGIVNRLRDVYRPSSNQEYKLTAIKPLITELEVLLETHLRRNNVKLVIEKDSMGEIHALAYADRLKQVFLNISLNAIEAMQPEGGELAIRLVESDEDGMFGIAFVDTGLGINPMDMSLIFDPFYTTKEAGMGLGLSICYDIVRDHSGSITVANNDKAGATFTVWLPKSVDTGA